MSTAFSFLLFFSLFFCSSLELQGAVAVRVGVLINPSPDIGEEQKIAIEVAVEEFSSSVSGGLSVNISESPSSAETLIVDWGANAIISSRTWLETLQIAQVASKARVPVLSLATQPIIIAPKPNIFQLAPSDSAYIQCLTDVIELYNWRQVNIIYEDDIYATTSASIVSSLNNALQAVGSEITNHVAIPSLDSVSDPKALLQQELRKLDRQLCKVYLVLRWASPTLAIDLFQQAVELGLMDRGHVWIVGDDITPLLDLNFTPAFVSSYMQGVIGIKAYFNDTSESYSDFRAKLQRKGNTSLEPGLSAARAYDAVHVIANAGSATSQDLLKGILTTSFIGLSGQVQFGSDRNLVQGRDSPTFGVINVVGRSYREMGLWYTGTGFRKDEKKMRQGVHWPGGYTGGVPGGWGKLRIGVPARPVFDEFVKVEWDSNGTVKDVTGFCIDVFKEATRRLDYELDYDFIPFNRTYDELVAAVPEVFDCLVGDVTILAKRLANVTFTEPFLSSGLSAFVPVKPDNTRWVLTKPFTKTVWFMIAASYLYNCLAVLYLERKENPEFDGPWTTQLGASAWLIFSAIFFAHGRLHSGYTKIVVAVWCIMLMVLTSVFTASLGSILVTQKLEPVVSDQKIGCNADSFSVEYLQEVMGYKSEQIVSITSVESYTAAFESGKITKGYLEAPYLRLFLAKHDGYTVYGDMQRLGGFGFVFPKNHHPLSSDFTKAILQLTEDGTLNRMEDKWFSLSMAACPTTVKDRIRESLGLETMWALFLITGAASTIALLLFKTKFIQSYGCRSLRSASLPLRERCASLWKDKMSNRTMLQFSRRHSLSPQIAPEPGDGSPENGEVTGDNGDGSLPNQNFA